jgi:hypothetical protein
MIVPKYLMNKTSFYWNPACTENYVTPDDFRLHYKPNNRVAIKLYSGGEQVQPGLVLPDWVVKAGVLIV